jgi:hypothetical protein
MIGETHDGHTVASFAADAGRAIRRRRASRRASRSAVASASPWSMFVATPTVGAAPGASWSQIGASLGASQQSACEAHQRWIDQQVERSVAPGHHGGLTEEDVEDAR